MTLSIEEEARSQGRRLLAGVDEAGRGPLAGPVVAAAVILPEGMVIDGLTDSKALTAAQRLRLFDVVHEKALAVGVGVADSQTVDRVNILQATLLAMRDATEKLAMRPDMLLIDGRDTIQWPGPQKAIVKGDSLCLCISAASVVAKVTRDAMMEKMAREYPQYGFEKHKGYGSREHREAIRKHGPCPQHRRTFRGVKEYLPQPEEPRIGLFS
ncbi:MAG: ribonuclease HII [Nitrospinota bacterium]|nr:ribonuclease HII [Nitrospinota bacterium]MDH5678400.1 ribonuclease HII [Nitrospinota bacterium]MDH5757856.1 ribonuclease HII [Nitrospinota bacterium]